MNKKNISIAIRNDHPYMGSCKKNPPPQIMFLAPILERLLGHP